jgi:hypothetical protein
LNEIAGDEIIEVDEIDRTLDGFEYFHKIYRRFKLTYREFMQRMNDENRTRNYYFSEYRVPSSLLKDISQPIFGKYMNLASVYYWDGIGTKSQGH